MLERRARAGDPEAKKTALGVLFFKKRFEARKIAEIESEAKALVAGEEDDRQHSAIYKAARAGDPKALLIVDRFVGKRLAAGLASGDAKMISTYKILKAQAEKGDKRAARVVKFADTAEVETELRDIMGDAGDVQIFMPGIDPTTGQPTTTSYDPSQYNPYDPYAGTPYQGYQGYQAPYGTAPYSSYPPATAPSPANAWAGTPPGGVTPTTAYPMVPGAMTSTDPDTIVRSWAALQTQLGTAAPQRKRHIHRKMKHLRNRYRKITRGAQGDIAMRAQQLGLASAVTGNAFVGATGPANELAAAKAIHDAAKKGNPRAKQLIKALAAHASAGDPEAIAAMHSLNKVVGASMGDDEVKPSAKMLDHLKQIARGLDSSDSGTSGTARADYQSLVEVARGGDKRAHSYLKIIDGLRNEFQAQAKAAKGVVTASLGAICGGETYRKGLMGDDESQSEVDRRMAKESWIRTYLKGHSSASRKEAEEVWSKKSSETSGDAFVGDFITAGDAFIGAMIGRDSYRRGLMGDAFVGDAFVGNAPPEFEMEDGPKSTLDPFFNRPVNVYDDAVSDPGDLAADDSSYIPEGVAEVEGVASVMGALCGTGCYRRGL